LSGKTDKGHGDGADKEQQVEDGKAGLKE